jgi:hypothetical protein
LADVWVICRRLQYSEGSRSEKAEKLQHRYENEFDSLWAICDSIGMHMIHSPKFRVRVIYDSAKKFFTKVSDLVPPITATDEIESDVLPLAPSP